MQRPTKGERIGIRVGACPTVRLSLRSRDYPCCAGSNPPSWNPPLVFWDISSASGITATSFSASVRYSPFAIATYCSQHASNLVQPKLDVPRNIPATDVFLFVSLASHLNIRAGTLR